LNLNTNSNNNCILNNNNNNNNTSVVQLNTVYNHQNNTSNLNNSGNQLQTLCYCGHCYPNIPPTLDNSAPVPPPTLILSHCFTEINLCDNFAFRNSSNSQQSQTVPTPTISETGFVNGNYNKNHNINNNININHNSSCINIINNTSSSGTKEIMVRFTSDHLQPVVQYPFLPLFHGTLPLIQAPSYSPTSSTILPILSTTATNTTATTTAAAISTTNQCFSGGAAAHPNLTSFPYYATTTDCLHKNYGLMQQPMQFIATASCNTPTAPTCYSTTTTTVTNNSNNNNNCNNRITDNIDIAAAATAATYKFYENQTFLAKTFGTLKHKVDAKKKQPKVLLSFLV
jgi:hypothetical protein